jgi:glycerol-3-phosphate acyltransferase PlsX
MKLAIDVMGFENDIIEPIKACRKFKRQHQDVEFILVGNKDKIQSLIKPNEFIIHPANDVIKMDDNPMIAMRKTDSSMYQAIQLVQNNQADGVLSAGSSSCYVPMSYLMLKLIDGINKPAFMPYVPTNNGKGFMLIDCGANKECSGEDLYQFAIMANIYCQTIRHINKPTIGVINIGTEAEKGLSHHHTANELLKKDQSLNYIGFVEPRYLLNGSVDIAVCDGYTGNITLKALEGGLSALKDSLKKEYKKP